MKHLTIVALFVAGLSSCGDGKKDAAEQVASDSTAAVPSAYVIDLAAYDLPLVVDMGDRSTLGVDTATVVWNEEFGHLEVKAGERFSLTITETPGDLPRLKADLDHDMLQKHTIVEETPEMLVYRSQFPDESLVYIHFLRIISVGERSFVVEDAVNGRFNEMDIKRMVGSVTAKSAV